MQLLSFEQWMTTVFVKSLGITFLHSFWQALLALIVCHVMLAMMKKKPAAFRYNALMFVAGTLAAAITVTFFMQFGSSGIAGHPLRNNVTFSYIYNSHLNSIDTVVSQWRAFTQNAGDILNNYINLIIAAWFIIFSYKCMRLSLGINYLKRVTRFGSAPAGNEWQVVFAELKRKLCIQKHISLLQSDIISVPMTTGFWKPVIIVPVSMLTNLHTDLVESILLHELAHIRRGDYFFNLVQSAAETIFFFNPFILKISSLIRDEREACCDTIALEVVQNKVSYVNALVAFGEYSNGVPMPALGYGGKKNSLLERVKRILFNQNKKPGVMEKSILACCLILLSGIAVFSSAKGTERTLKTEIISKLQSFVQDTVPSEVNERKAARREERRARQEAKQAKEAERKISVEEKREIEKAVQDLEEQQEHLTQQIERLQGLKEEQIEKSKIDAEIRAHHLSEAQMKEIEEAKVQALQQALASTDMIKLQHQQNFNKEIQEAMANVQLQLQNTVKVNTQQQKVLLQQYLNDSLPLQLKNIRVGTGVVDEIIDYLDDHDVADRKEITSFSLDENELKVNGKVQPAEMHQELKKRYLGRKGDHVNYLRSGGSTSISIQRNDPDDSGDD